jgi:hypothetical protein
MRENYFVENSKDVKNMALKRARRAQRLTEPKKTEIRYHDLQRK